MEEQELLNLWEKATKFENYDSTKWRKDASGAWIAYSQYGNRQSTYGWEVDHIVPKSKLEDAGASQEEIDNPLNLRPYNWANNDSKSDDYPEFRRAVTAKDNHNVENTDWREISKDLQRRLHQLYGKYSL